MISLLKAYFHKWVVKKRLKMWEQLAKFHNKKCSENCKLLLIK